MNKQDIYIERKPHCPKCGLLGHYEEYDGYRWLYCDCGSSFCDGELAEEGKLCLIRQNIKLTKTLQHVINKYVTCETCECNFICQKNDDDHTCVEQMLMVIGD